MKKHARDLLANSGVEDADGDAYPTDKYNIAPGTRIRAVRGGKKKECVSLLWDFRVLSVKLRAPSAPLLANARAEGLWEKPTFREAARLRRCLIPASGFYEWEHVGRARLPWLFQLREEMPFFLAGIWEHAIGADAPGTCAVVTTEPNDVMRPIHHRMPAIILPENADAWLDGGVRGLLAPLDSARMVARRVSSFVNDARNEGAGCIAAPVGETTERQGLLF